MFSELLIYISTKTLDIFLSMAISTIAIFFTTKIIKKKYLRYKARKISDKLKIFEINKNINSAILNIANGVPHFETKTPILAKNSNRKFFLAFPKDLTENLSEEEKNSFSKQDIIQLNKNIFDFELKENTKFNSTKDALEYARQ